MIQISALPAFTDNYIWLLQDPDTRRCAVVDPGDAAPVQAWLAANPGWVLSDILITHHHHDHVGGVEQLKATAPPSTARPAKTSRRDVALKDNDRINVLGWDFDVIAVPGHTLGHIAYYHRGLLFCGDTLFAAGCGRLFEGTPCRCTPRCRAWRPSRNTLVYCTHEYTLSNLRLPRRSSRQSRYAGTPRHRYPPTRRHHTAFHGGPGKTYQPVFAHR
jgi:hydroxyacylglutathione hydrolase